VLTAQDEKVDVMLTMADGIGPSVPAGLRTFQEQATDQEQEK
jgi:hypothetical protein